MRVASGANKNEEMGVRGDGRKCKPLGPESFLVASQKQFMLGTRRASMRKELLKDGVRKIPHTFILCRPAKPSHAPGKLNVPSLFTYDLSLNLRSHHTIT
jgi:hypothetical protein